MTRATTTNASEWSMACTHLVATHKATVASSSSPTLEGEATLEPFPQWLEGSASAGPAPPTNMLPAHLVFTSGSGGREALASRH